jgi:hypothetical protein
MASLIVGLLWALWHLPDALQAFPLHIPLSQVLSLEGSNLLQFLALSILMTWTVNSSKGRIALACILHMSSGVLPHFWPDAFQANFTFGLIFNSLLLKSCCLVQ